MIRLSDVVREQGRARAGRSGSGGKDAWDTPPFHSLSQRDSAPRLALPSGSTEWDQDWYQRAQVELEHLATLLSQQQSPCLDELRTRAEGLVNALHIEEHVMAQAFFPGPKGSTILAHSINVGLIATKVGMGLSFGLNTLIDLCLAGFLHDVGQFLLLKSEGVDTHQFESHDEAEVRQHSERGHQILTRLNKTEGWLSEVVLQIHERWDGQGYPHSLKGDTIHEFSQIIGLADRFETLVNRKGISAHEAIRILLTKEKTGFSGHLLKVFVQQLSLFPVGTMVQLSSGEIGTVKRTNPQHPLKPILLMKSDSNRKSSSEPRLKDLSQDHLVHIVKVVKEQEPLLSSGR